MPKIIQTLSTGYRKHHIVNTRRWESGASHKRRSQKAFTHCPELWLADSSSAGGLGQGWREFVSQKPNRDWIPLPTFPQSCRRQNKLAFDQRNNVCEANSTSRSVICLTRKDFVTRRTQLRSRTLAIRIGTSLTNFPGDSCTPFSSFAQGIGSWGTEQRAIGRSRQTRIKHLLKVVLSSMILNDRQNDSHLTHEETEAQRD